MNQAAQWSPTAVQKTWPMQSFWIGLMEDSPGHYIWDDNSAYSFNYFTKTYAPVSSACYYADVNGTNYTWTQTLCSSSTAVAPTLICQDSLCKWIQWFCFTITVNVWKNLASIHCSNGYFLSQNNICYWTNTTTKMDVATARKFCNSNQNGTLSSFHSASEWTSFVSQMWKTYLNSYPSTNLTAFFLAIIGGRIWE